MVRSGSSKFCVHLGSWPLYLPGFSDAHLWWRGCGGCGKRSVSQGTEAVRLKMGKGISNRIVSAQDVSSRECKVVFECLTCDCSNEVNYPGRLGVFRVYDGNQTCCHTTCGSFYKTRPHKIQAKYMGNSSYHWILIPLFWRSACGGGASGTGTIHLLRNPQTQGKQKHQCIAEVPVERWPRYMKRETPHSNFGESVATC